MRRLVRAAARVACGLVSILCAFSVSAAQPNQIQIETYAHGLHGDGVTDDAAIFNSGLVNAGCGEVYALGTYLFDSDDLRIPACVTLKGPYARPGISDNGDYSSSLGLVINPSHTVRLNRGGGLENIIVRRKGLINPNPPSGSNAPQALLLANLYALTSSMSTPSGGGTGITFGDGGQTEDSGSSALLRDVLVLGFYQCVTSIANNLFEIEDVHGDCWNGVKIVDVGELGMIRGIHLWPYLVYGGPGSTFTVNKQPASGMDYYFYSPAIAGIDASGQYVRIGFGQPHFFAVGQIVTIAGASVGALNTGVPVTITAADPTHIVVNVPYTSSGGQGGNVYATVVQRGGEGLTLTYQKQVASGCDHCTVSDAYFYGWQTGAHVTSSDHVTLTNFRYDNWNAPQNSNTTGILLDGTTGSFRAVAPKIASAAVTVHDSSHDGMMPYNQIVLLDAWGTIAQAVLKDGAGRTLTLNGGGLDQTPGPGYSSVDSIFTTNGNTFLTGGLQVSNNTVTTSGAGVTLWNYNEAAPPGTFVGIGGGGGAVYINGAPTASQILMRKVFDRVTELPPAMPGSSCTAGKPATRAAVFTLQKNNRNFGNITFAAGSTTCTVTIVQPSTFAVGDVLTLQAPNPADATLAQIAFNLALGN
jgi:hypothetical protein